jgi:hypothetical protein
MCRTRANVRRGTVSAMSTTINKRLIDEAMDVYVDWLELCLDVQRAYERWEEAPRSEAGIAFRDYQDALVREEHASLRYAFLVGCADE